MTMQHQKQDRKTGNQNFLKETRKILTMSSVDNRIFRVRCASHTQISSNVAGIINTTFSLNPNTFSHWTELSSLYDEFRVVGCEIQLCARQIFSVTALSALVAICFDNDDSSVLTNWTAALEYPTMKVVPAMWANDKVYKFTWARPSAGKETTIMWQDCAVPAGSVGGLKFYADTLTASTSYFDVIYSLACEFRGLR